MRIIIIIIIIIIIVIYLFIYYYYFEYLKILPPYHPSYDLLIVPLCYPYRLRRG